jgi:hypothetical protein
MSFLENTLGGRIQRLWRIGPRNAPLRSDFGFGASGRGETRGNPLDATEINRSDLPSLLETACAEAGRNEEQRDAGGRMTGVESKEDYRTEIIGLARLYRDLLKSFKINLPKKWQVG